MPSCDSLLFVCFALNSVETREGMPLLSFLDENRGNILVTLGCFVQKTFSYSSLKFIVVLSVFFLF